MLSCLEYLQEPIELRDSGWGWVEDGGGGGGSQGVEELCHVRGRGQVSFCVCMLGQGRLRL